MNYKIIKYVMGIVLCFGAIFMLLPCLVAIYYHEHAVFPFFVCAMGTGLLGLALARRKPENTTMFAKEGIVIVAVCWILLSFIGAIPYLATGSIRQPINALFESVSGFTTTGASILAEIDGLPHCILFWRCFSQWIGGMGVLVFIMAVLPNLGASNLYLMRAESSGPSVRKFLPKMQSMAFLLYAIYIALTILEFVLLVIAGMPVFDALCDSLSTAGTGGFAVRTDSIASYSRAVKLIIAIFMLLFGVNFQFYFLLLMKHIKEAFRMEEVRWYVVIYTTAVCLIAINLTFSVGQMTTGEIQGNFEDAIFQVATVMTSSGFATVDYARWPEFSQTLMLIVMCVGACSGSTACGIKISRVLLYVKAMGKELEFQLHPRSVRKIKMDDKTVDHETLRSTKAFLLAYIFIIVLATLIISIDQFDFRTNFTASIAMLNNIGPGLGNVGPTCCYESFSPLSKFVMMFEMLAGRLEIVPMLVLLTPGTWKKQ